MWTPYRTDSTVASLLSRLARTCAGLGDLERALARIQANSAAEVEGANAAIYYEDTAKRKVLSLLTALRGLQSMQVSFLASTSSVGSMMDSPVN